MNTDRLYIYLAFILVSLGLLSCVGENADSSSGYEELGDCYGVYFPSQKNATKIEFVPIGQMSDGEKVTSYTRTFSVNRLNSEDEIVVPVTVTPDDGSFSVSEIKFTEGQTKTTFDVTLSADAQLGTTYDCSINIEDPKYVFAYSQYSSGIDFSAIVVQWNRLKGKKGEEYGRFRDDFLTAAYVGINDYWKTNENTEVIFEERSDKPGYFRLNDVYSAEFWGPNGGTTVAAVEKAFLNPPIIIDATNPDKVLFPYQEIGMDYGYGQLAVCSLVSDYIADLEPSENKYGTYDKENGIIEFPVNGLLVLEGGNPYVYGNPNGLARIVLPGFDPIDHSVRLEPEYSNGGTVKIGYTFGSHVTKIKYAVYSGVMDEKAAELKAEELQSNPDAASTTKKEGSLEIKALEKTGVYTLVTANYGADGKLAGSSSARFTYIAAGDDVPVVLTPELAATNKYSSQGFTAENSLEMYICGKSIEEAYLRVARGDYSSYTQEELLEEFFTPYINSGQLRPLDSELLSMINGVGYTDLFYGLTPGYPYTVMVYADNGYKKEVISTVGYTKGEYDIKYDTFYYDPDSALATIQPVSDLKALGGSYDFYAVDLMKSKGVREKIGTVEITVEEDWNDNVTAIEPVGIVVKGLTGGGAKEAGLESDDMYFKFVKSKAGTASYIGSQPNTYVRYDSKEGDYVPFTYMQDGKIPLPVAPGCIGSQSDGSPLYVMVVGAIDDMLLYGGVAEGLDGSKALVFGDSYAYYMQYGLSFSGMGLFGWDSANYLAPMRIFSAYDSIMLIPHKEGALKSAASGVRYESKFAGLKGAEREIKMVSCEFQLGEKVVLPFAGPRRQVELSKALPQLKDNVKALD